MTDNRKLGRKPVLTSRLMAVPGFPDYASQLPQPPPTATWSRQVSQLGSMLNLEIGDCTCAAAAHAIQIWTAANGHEVVPADQDVLAMYEAVGGYRPGDPNTDQGCVILDVLNAWRQNGLADHKLEGYARIRAGNQTGVRQAIAMFGAIYLGVDLPAAWQRAEVWDVGRGRDYQPGSWGGHAVVAADYSSEGITVISWGERVPMTWRALERYASEIYVMLDNDWADSDRAPNNFSYDELAVDLGYFHGRAA